MTQWTWASIKCPTFITAFAVIGHCAGAAQVSLLRFHPGAGIEPRPIVRVDPLYGNDLLIPQGNFGCCIPFAALPDAFCGKDEELRRKFRDDFKKYLATPLHHPACTPPADPNIELYTYRKPYETHQTEFLEWLRRNTGRTDFLGPSARKWNDYRGDQASPLVRVDQLNDEQIDKRTFGQLAAFTADALTIVINNKTNPLRWIAPINEIHHHEQPSLCVLLRSAPQELARSEAVLRSFFKGDHSRRILVEYDIELSVADLRAEMGEYSIEDYLRVPNRADSKAESVVPFGSVLPGALKGDSAPGDLVAQSLANTRRYAQPPARPEDPALPALTREANKRWLATRFEPINIQAGLMLNFREVSPNYRLAEFMIASKNQQPLIYYPPAPGAEGFIPTACDKINPYFVDGGNIGNVSWFRMRIDAMRLAGLTKTDPDLDPIREGGEHYLIPDGSSTRRLRGVFDVTDYYALARKYKFFPGQRGYCGKRWVGFKGDVAEFVNPAEQHGLYWLGFIIENHGPFRVSAKIQRLNAYISGE